MSNTRVYPQRPGQSGACPEYMSPSPGTRAGLCSDCPPVASRAYPGHTRIFDYPLVRLAMCRSLRLCTCSGEQEVQVGGEGSEGGRSFQASPSIRTRGILREHTGHTRDTPSTPGSLRRVIIHPGHSTLETVVQPGNGSGSTRDTPGIPKILRICPRYSGYSRDTPGMPGILRHSGYIPAGYTGYTRDTG